MNDPTPTILERIQGQLLELSVACASGRINPGRLAREAFLLGRRIGQLEQPAQDRAEDDDDEKE